MSDDLTGLPTVQDQFSSRKCTGCGASGAYPFNYGHVSSTDDFCPRCTRNMALTEAASDQLERLIKPILEEWAAHWGQILGRSGLHGAFDGLHDNLSTLTTPILEQQARLGGIDPQA